MKSTIIALFAVLASPAAAQTGSGLGGLLGGALPNVGAASAGNAAGLLGYCVKNKLVGGANAQSVLGKLSGNSAITDSPAYTAGQSGILQTGRSNLSVGNLKGQLKTRVCDLILKRAGSFL